MTTITIITTTLSVCSFCRRLDCVRVLVRGESRCPDEFGSMTLAGPVSGTTSGTGRVQVLTLQRPAKLSRDFAPPYQPRRPLWYASRRGCSGVTVRPHPARLLASLLLLAGLLVLLGATTCDTPARPTYAQERP